MNQIWRCNMSHFHDLVEEASTTSSSTNCVYYKDDNDHKHDDTIPSLLLF